MAFQPAQTEAPPRNADKTPALTWLKNRFYRKNAADPASETTVSPYEKQKHEAAARFRQQVMHSGNVPDADMQPPSLETPVATDRMKDVLGLLLTLPLISKHAPEEVGQTSHEQKTIAHFLQELARKDPTALGNSLIPLVHMGPEGRAALETIVEHAFDIHAEQTRPAESFDIQRIQQPHIRDADLAFEHLLDYPLQQYIPERLAHLLGKDTNLTVGDMLGWLTHDRKALINHMQGLFGNKENSIGYLFLQQIQMYLETQAKA